MSDLRRNMILGAVLTTAFTLAILGVVTPMLFEKTPPAKPGYAIAVSEAASGEEAPAPPPDWGTVLKTADVSAGEAKTASATPRRSAPGLSLHSRRSHDRAGTSRNA